MSTMTRGEFFRRTAGVGLALYLGSSLKPPRLPASAAAAPAVPAIPVGSVMPFTTAALPDGWVLCDGSAIEVSEYPALYRVIANAYGGSRWRRRFRVPALPDMRGRVVGHPLTPGDPARAETDALPPYLTLNYAIKAA